MKKVVLMIIAFLGIICLGRCSHTHKSKAQVDKVSEIDSYLKKLASDSKFMGYIILSHGDSIRAC